MWEDIWCDFWGDLLKIFHGYFCVDFLVSVQKDQLRGIYKNILYSVVFSIPGTTYCGLEKISLKYIFHGDFSAIFEVGYRLSNRFVI